MARQINNNLLPYIRLFFLISFLLNIFLIFVRNYILINVQIVLILFLFINRLIDFSLLNHFAALDSFGKSFNSANRNKNIFFLFAALMFNASSSYYKNGLDIYTITLILYPVYLITLLKLK